MAKKYVHNFAKYMTIYELMDEIYPLLTTSKTKEEILDYQDIFLEIYKRVDSIAKVISICENKSYEKFIKLFK